MERRTEISGILIPIRYFYVFWFESQQFTISFFILYFSLQYLNPF